MGQYISMKKDDPDYTLQREFFMKEKKRGRYRKVSVFKFLKQAKLIMW